MSKFLPLFLVVVGIGVLTGALLLIRSSSSQTGQDEVEETVPAVALADRPVTSLTPSSDGHWLELSVKKIKISAATMDYELLYSLPDGRKQGVPGTVKLTAVEEIERDLLLGSESSGKYRYDEGVETGTITLRFRSTEGKLVAKFVANFHLQSNTKNLGSTDGKFSYILEKNPGKEFFVTMETFGLPADAPGEVKAGPYGVFKGVAKVNTAKGTLPITTKVFAGSVKLAGTVYKATSSGWEKLSEGKSNDVGIFVGTSE